MSVPCWHCGSPTEVTAASGQAELRRCAVADCFSNFRGPGVASFLVAEQRKANLQEDAERLAELREELQILWPTNTARSDVNAIRLSDREKTLRTLIAVYEECAARGRTFGGVR